MIHQGPLTNFTFIDDDETVIEVPFIVLPDSNSGTYRDWNIEEDVVLTRIPGTNITYEESLGFGLATVTWRLGFNPKDNFFRFSRLRGKVGTLTVLEGFQSLKGSATTLHTMGYDYELLDHTKVASIAPAAHEVDNWTEVDVTFSRAVDPATGLAVVS